MHARRLPRAATATRCGDADSERTSFAPTNGDSAAGGPAGVGHAATASSFATVHRMAATFGRAAGRYVP